MKGKWSAALVAVFIAIAGAPAASQSPGPSTDVRQRRMSRTTEARAERQRVRAAAKDAAQGEKPEGSTSRSLSEGKDTLYSQVYKTRNYRMTRMLLQKVLEANPTDPDAHARLGLSLTRAGHYQEAVESLEYGVAADIYGEECLGGHADALRFLGDLDGAMELRWQRILSAAGEPGETAAWESLAEDYRWAGDFEAAEQAMWMAGSIQPGSPEVLLSFASLYMDMGDLDEAEFYLWLSNLEGDAGLTERRERARYLMLRGYLEEAASVLDVIKGRFRLQANVAVLRAEIYRRDGSPEAGEALISGRRLVAAEYPYYLAERAALAVSLGELDEADEWIALGRALYPRDPDVVRAAALAERARAGSRG